MKRQDGDWEGCTRAMAIIVILVFIPMILAMIEEAFANLP